MASTTLKIAVLAPMPSASVTTTAAVNPGTLIGDPVRGYLGYAHGKAGRREEAEKLAADRSLSLFGQAQIFACLGDKDRAFEALYRAAVAGPVRMGRLLRFQGYSQLGDDPRMKALRKKVGLPE